MYFAYLLVTDGFITACFSPEMKRAAAEQSPVEEEKEFRCQNWNHSKGRVPEGPPTPPPRPPGSPADHCSARCVSLAPTLVRSVARPLRPTRCTNKGCVCSCQESGCCRATVLETRQSLLFSFFKLGSWKFSFSGHPQAVVVTKLRPLGGSTERTATALSIHTGHLKTASHPLSKGPLCLSLSKGPLCFSLSAEKRSFRSLCLCRLFQ